MGGDEANVPQEFLQVADEAWSIDEDVQAAVALRSCRNEVAFSYCRDEAAHVKGQAKNNSSAGGRLAAQGRDIDELRSLRGEPVKDARQSLCGRVRPRVQEDDRVVALADSLQDSSLNGVGVRGLVPIAWVNVPADMHVTQLLEAAEHPRVVHACAEWAAKPWPRVDPCDFPDQPLGLADVHAEARLGERVHGSVMVRVVPDQMTR